MCNNIKRWPLHTYISFRIDSQCKYAMVARGDSDVYLRLSSLDYRWVQFGLALVFVYMIYREMIWDHAAGVLIVEEAGGKVVDFRGNSLDFSVGMLSVQ